MIIGQHGTPQSPHYYLEIDSDERYSARLRKMFRHTYLRLRHSMDGPTETGGLIVTQAMRRRPERIGKQLSWVRFAYIGRHLKRFQDRVIAEMLPPTTDDQGNIFWDHYGQARDGIVVSRGRPALGPRQGVHPRAVSRRAALHVSCCPTRCARRSEPCAMKAAAPSGSWSRRG